MLPVEIYYRGAIEGYNLGSLLMELFDGFKLIKLFPGDDLKRGRLQLCRPEEYGELMEHIQESESPAESLLELRGPRSKLQKTVRQKLFFDENNKYEKVFLEGCGGIGYFPWAVQVVMVQPPVADLEVDVEWVEKAEIMILNDTTGIESKDFSNRVKKINRDLPIYLERVQEGLSRELQERLKFLFDVYQGKRENVKAVLQQKLPEQLISCRQAGNMAAELEVSMPLIGNVCDELGYKIIGCGLGCF